MKGTLFYKWSTLRRLFKYSSWIIRLFELPRIRKYAKNQDEASPVFIIGLPRSGSTFLYQLITNYFDVLYFDNLVNIGRENLYFSVWLSNLIYRDKPHNSFSSNFGNTTESGLHAPSEAGMLWYRWFPGGDAELENYSLSEKSKNELKDSVLSVIGRHQKPLVIKNLNMVLRMKVIKDLFPGARFIYIRRDPVYIAQSIYQARKANAVDHTREWWSVPIPGYQSLLELPEEMQIARQVTDLQQLIEKELAELSAEKIMEVKYEDIDEDLVNKLKHFLGVEFRSETSISDITFRNTNKINIDIEVFNSLQEELNRNVTN
ncbi:sulfotransferase [Bacteroidota bacterium]